MRKMIWLRFWVLLPLIVVLVIGSRVYISSVAGTHEVRGMLPHEGEVITASDVSLGEPGVVEVVSVEQDEAGRVRVTFRATGDGLTEASVGMGDARETWSLRVREGCIFEGGVNFTGWESIHICACVLLAVLVALFASVVVQLWRGAWFGYTMVASGGGLLFSLFQLAFFGMLLVRGSLREFADFAEIITTMADWFVMVSLVPMALLALLVSLSNVSLIRHEGLRPVNLLGIGASLVWAGVCAAWLRWGGLVFSRLSSIAFVTVADSLVATAITFGECLLLSTILCGWLASRHVPKRGMDYLVILGCGLRADGTPSPLLAGRVDRARTFDEERVAAGDAPTTFVPSGGKGADEVISEAQSMRNYLVEHGVDSERVVLEDRSATTRENMAFSREVIERHAGRSACEVRVGFSTTNYHVLRGYVCAHEAGMAVEGMGSKTRAYFWPNAFLREFVGLLAARWRIILQVYLLLSVIYALSEYALLVS